MDRAGDEPKTLQPQILKSRMLEQAGGDKANGRLRSTVDHDPRARLYTLQERRADLIVHVIGLAAALVGATTLIIVAGRRDFGSVASLSIYGLCIVLCFAASAAYNLGYHTKARALLRRLDHSAIFLLIAGTYTPFTMRLPAHREAVFVTLGVWAACCAGIAVKLISPSLFERVGVGLYIGLGWASLLIFRPLSASLAGAPIVLLAIGGALYTVGVCFHLMQRLRFHNAIWHVFVLAAASCHFTSVLSAFVLR